MTPCVVLPEWFDELSEGERRVVLGHEVEHLRARDPAWLLAGTVLVALLPWNLALWWMLRRFHLAIELDCDQRLLSRGTSAGQYGRALLAVADRMRVERPGLAPTFVAPTHQLRERIRALAPPRPVLPLPFTAAWRLTWTAAALAAAVTLTSFTLSVSQRVELWRGNGYSGRGGSSFLHRLFRTLPTRTVAMITAQPRHDSLLVVLIDSAGRFVDARYGPPRLHGRKTLAEMFPTLSPARFDRMEFPDSATVEGTPVRLPAIVVSLRSPARATADSIAREGIRSFALEAIRTRGLDRVATTVRELTVYIVVRRDRRLVDVVSGANSLFAYPQLNARFPESTQDGTIPCFVGADDGFPNLTCYLVQLRD
jgi:hypothetical protein